MAKHTFYDYKVIKDQSGTLAAKITYREDNQQRKLYSFSLHREIVLDQPDGSTETSYTIWLHRRHIDALRDLLDEVENQLELVETEERKRRKFSNSPRITPRNGI